MKRPFRTAAAIKLDLCKFNSIRCKMKLHNLDLYLTAL